jgi:2-keto-4-pentenoate hydratase/2-oxohepta-3-ene-1,7-dioic acid hydratase in catechol pathway
VKIARILRNGKPAFGLLEGGFIRICAGAATLEEVIGGRWEQSDWTTAESAQYLTPVPATGKIICVGLNYRDHAAEVGHAVPDYPPVFLRAASSLLAHRRPMLLPLASMELDGEAELAVIIGKSAKHVTKARALDYVAGYTCFNDATVRDFQRRSSQWTMGKNFDRTGALGPLIVTPDELPPGASGLRICLRVNGEIRQDSNTAEMVFDVATLISLLSEVMTLEPGDVIATGTPAGVGYARKPPRFLKPGDVCEVEIEGIGRLINTFTDE